MKKLGEFITNINEAGRGRPRKNPLPEEGGNDIERTPRAAKEEEKEKRISDKVKPGVPADKNGTRGVWAVDEPTEKDINFMIDKETMGNNIRRIARRIASKKAFFVQGEAGWGKTSIIKKLAKRRNLHIITVYLDKAQKEDLGGIPVPREDKKSGRAYQDMALPGWAQYMQENEDMQFLLFFDEMNQATPDIMNALMPIIQEREIAGVRFNNFIVGAAGNFEYENKDGISELSAPLLDRFGGIIYWETDWDSAFMYLHKEWDDVFGKEIIDEFEKYAPDAFRNPRVIEQKVWQSLVDMLDDPDKDLFGAEDILEDMHFALKPDASRSIVENKLPKLADKLQEWFEAGGKKVEKKEDSSRKPRKDISMIPDDVKEMLTAALEQGVLWNADEPNKKYGISLENIYSVCGEEESLNKEIIDRFIKKYIADGNTVKYKTDDEWKADGYLDPNKD